MLYIKYSIKYKIIYICIKIYDNLNIIYIYNILNNYGFENIHPHMNNLTWGRGFTYNWTYKTLVIGVIHTSTDRGC